MENLLQYSIKDEKEFEISDGETNTISKDKMEQFEPSNDLIDYLTNKIVFEEEEEC